MLAAHGNNLADMDSGLLVEGSHGEGILAGAQGQQKIGFGSEAIAGRSLGHTLVMSKYVYAMVVIYVKAFIYLVEWAVFGRVYLVYNLLSW